MTWKKLALTSQLHVAGFNCVRYLTFLLKTYSFGSDFDIYHYTIGLDNYGVIVNTPDLFIALSALEQNYYYAHCTAHCSGSDCWQETVMHTLYVQFGICRLTG